MNFMRILVILPLICISWTPVQGSNRRNPSWLWRKRKLDEYAAPAILLRLSNPKTDKRKPFVILPNPPARSSPSPARPPSAPHEPNALLPSQRSPLPPPPLILMRPSPPPQRRPPSPPPPPPTRPPPPLPSKPRLPPKTAPPPPRLSSPLVPLSRPPSPQLMLTLAPLPRSASPPPRSPSPRLPSPTRRPPPPPPPRLSPPPPRSPSPRSPSPTRRPPPPPPRRPPPPTPPPPRPPSPVPPSPLPPHPHPPPPTRRPPPPQSPRIKPPPPLKPPPLLAPAVYFSSPPLANRGDVDSGTLPGSFCSDGQAMLEQINTYRALHNAPPLVWSSSLAAEAQAYAIQQSNIASEAFATTELCSADHSASGGESLYSSANAPPPDSSCKRAIASFYTEEKVYNYASPNLGDASAWHFVQMVWRGSTNVGCGVSVSDIVVRNYGLGGCKVVVCRFYPGFYLSSEAFQSNVLPPTDTSK